MYRDSVDVLCVQRWRCLHLTTTGNLVSMRKASRVTRFLTVRQVFAAHSVFLIVRTS